MTRHTPAFQRLARAQKAYTAAFNRALDAGAELAAFQLEQQAAQLNAYADFAELVTAHADKENPR